MIAGLETIHFLNQQAIELPFDIEIVDFLEAELNVCGASYLGGRYMAGLLENKLLTGTNQDGCSLAEEITKAGGTSRAPSTPRQDTDSTIACLELHIEQANRLESSQIDIGIVTDILGIRRYAIKVKGKANHSGTIRMHDRKDALVTASHFVTTIRDLALEISLQDKRHFLATIGRFEVHANAAAIIPGEVRLLLGVRAFSEQSSKQFSSKIVSSIL